MIHYRFKAHWNAAMMINLPADEIVLGDSQISTGDKIGIFIKEKINGYVLDF